MRTGGVATVSMLVLLIVGTVIGALVGLALGGSFQHAIVAIIAGMAGTLAAVIAQNALVHGQGRLPRAIAAVTALAAGREGDGARTKDRAHPQREAAPDQELDVPGLWVDA
jgi:hypothetical protein